MKFIHIADLHLGKRVNEYQMTEDQEYILKEIMRIAGEEKAEGVIIAGDVYDKPVPPSEAVRIFDDFLYGLSKMGISVFVISGNHDSPERLSFGSRLMDTEGIHIAPVYSGHTEPVTMEDEYGPISIYMLPFIKPAHIRRFSDKEIVSYTDALREAIDLMDMDFTKRNLLVTHQFVTGAVRSDSEDISVGGTDNVDVSVFSGIDYTALGHIHRAQKCGSENVRYSGTPLKYSLSEVDDKKSVTVVELKEKGDISVRLVPLSPLRDMHSIRGSYDELMKKSFYEGTTYRDDYMHIILTDEEDIPYAAAKLSTVYHNLMKLEYDNQRTRINRKIDAYDDPEKKTPFELFSDLYELQNNAPMTDEQKEFIKGAIEDIWEDEI